jgi:hypothetical protein
VPAAPPRELPLPHRDAAGHTKYRNREWATLRLGTLTLAAGRTTLGHRGPLAPGRRSHDFKHLRLICTPDPSPAHAAAGAPVHNVDTSRSFVQDLKP